MMSMNGICDGWDLIMVCCNHNAFDGYRSWHKYILQFSRHSPGKTPRVQVVASSPTLLHNGGHTGHLHFDTTATNSIRLPFNNSSNKNQIKHSTSPPIHLTYPPPSLPLSIMSVFLCCEACQGTLYHRATEPKLSRYSLCVASRCLSVDYRLLVTGVKNSF